MLSVFTDCLHHMPFLTRENMIEGSSHPQEASREGFAFIFCTLLLLSDAVVVVPLLEGILENNFTLNEHLVCSLIREPKEKRKKKLMVSSFLPLLKISSRPLHIIHSWTVIELCNSKINRRILLLHNLVMLISPSRFPISQEISKLCIFHYKKKYIRS